MEKVINTTKLTKAQEVINRATGIFNRIKSDVIIEMKLWDGEDAEQIIRDLGTKAESLFNLHFAMQMILKNADPEWEFLRPYKTVQVEEQAVDKDGNLMFETSYKPIIDEETGFQKLDENGKVITEKIEIPMIAVRNKKITLEPTWNEDGSLNELLPIE